MVLAQAIIGTSFYSAGGGGGGGIVSTVGQYVYDSNTYNYYAAYNNTNLTYPKSTSYRFPDETQSNVIEFDGNSYQFTQPLGVNDSFFINLWIYPLSNNRAILAETNSGSEAGSLTYYYNMMEIDSSGYVRAGVYNGTPIASVTSPNQVTLNAWNHIYFYYDRSESSGTIHLEVNGGTAATQSSVNRSGPGSSYYALGLGTATSITTSAYFLGYMHNLETHDSLHGSNYEIFKSKYQAQPVFALRAADYTSNGTWTDAIAGKRFTMYNDPTWSDTNGGQIRFHAANSEYADSSTSLSSLTSYTLQGVFQVQTSIQSSAQCIITEKYWEGISKINYALGYINGGGTQIDAGFFNINEGYWNVLTAKSSPAANTWYDVVCTFYGPTRELKVYLDGTLVSSTTAPGTTGSENTGINIAKRWDLPDYLDGTIKDIKIWNGVLTPSEVAAQHTAYSSLV